ncbi:UNVERIFIED_CONTAM: hypothetical protein Slati_4610800 [Sesamum latifolium]|uniref:Retrotransposon gag domain-containing protein n=1 Tax=Sesamum latifolium TaxID=2727402 RepID=A0AAW2RP00_9LAMI
MENPNNTANKQKAAETSDSTQALKVVTKMPSTPIVAGSTPATLAQATPLPRIVSAAIREQVADPAPARVATPSDVDAPKEEAEEVIPVPKGLQDVQYQIGGAPEDERQGIPFTEAVMADELLVNCRTPAITEYDGTTDPLEHLARFENATLHRYILTGSNVGSSSPPLPGRKLQKTELNLFAIRQKDNEPLKEYLQRFNTVALEVPSTTQEVKASAFSQGLLDRDFFKSLAKKPVSKFDALLARAAKYINMEDAQAAKKESRGKRKEVKEEAPSKKPQNEF